MSSLHLVSNPCRRLPALGDILEFAPTRSVIHCAAARYMACCNGIADDSVSWRVCQNVTTSYTHLTHFLSPGKQHQNWTWQQSRPRSCPPAMLSHHHLTRPPCKASNPPLASLRQVCSPHRQDLQRQLPLVVLLVAPRPMQHGSHRARLCPPWWSTWPNGVPTPCS